VSRAVVIATGGTADGGREVLGLDVDDSEGGAFWTAFLRSLKAVGSPACSWSSPTPTPASSRPSWPVVDRCGTDPARTAGLPARAVGMSVVILALPIARCSRPLLFIQHLAMAVIAAKTVPLVVTRAWWWAWVAEDGGEGRAVATHTTNNRLELRAVLELLRGLDRSKSVIIQTDSAYVIGVFTHWLEAWRRKGMRTSRNAPVENPDLIEAIAQELDRRHVRFEKAPGHTGHRLRACQRESSAVGALGG
jgi:ribonuclease HI